MTEQSKHTITKICIFMLRIIGVYFTITCISNIVMEVILLLTDLDGYKQYSLQFWSGVTLTDRDFFIKETLDVAFYSLRGVHGVFCIFPFKKPYKWNRAIVWGCIGFISVIIYQILYHQITGALFFNSLPYILAFTSIVLSVIGRLIAPKANSK